jgi:hypothetical protein
MHLGSLAKKPSISVTSTEPFLEKSLPDLKLIVSNSTTSVSLGWKSRF